MSSIFSWHETILFANTAKYISFKAIQHVVAVVGWCQSHLTNLTNPPQLSSLWRMSNSVSKQRHCHKSGHFKQCPTTNVKGYEQAGGVCPSNFDNLLIEMPSGVKVLCNTNPIPLTTDNSPLEDQSYFTTPRTQAPLKRFLSLLIWPISGGGYSSWSTMSKARLTGNSHIVVGSARMVLMSPVSRQCQSLSCLSLAFILY